jgi:hypothetical protein
MLNELIEEDIFDDESDDIDDLEIDLESIEEEIVNDINHYVDPKELVIHLSILSETFKKRTLAIIEKEKIPLKAAEKKAKGDISEELGDMFLKIALNLSSRFNYNKYPYKDEMIGLGVEYLCRFARKFDKTNPKANAFSYCTQICSNGFKQVIKKEKARLAVKDKIIKNSLIISEAEKWQRDEKNSNHDDY